MQHQLAVPERLVVDRQRVPVVAELLEGTHDAGAQPVVAAVRIQDACSLLTAQDFHRRDVDPGRCQVPGQGLHLRPLGQQAYHAEGGPVIEVIDVDLGLVHVTIFAACSAVPGLSSVSGSRPAQRQRRQLTAPGWEPAVTSPFSAPKAARTSAFSRSGTLKSSMALISSWVTSSNTSGEILRSQCASRISKPVYWNGPPAFMATHRVLPHFRPGIRVWYVTVCHSRSSGFALTIFGFFTSRSLKLSMTAAMAKMPPRRS